MRANLVMERMQRIALRIAYLDNSQGRQLITFLRLADRLYLLLVVFFRLYDGRHLLETTRGEVFYRLKDYLRSWCKAHAQSGTVRFVDEFQAANAWLEERAENGFAEDYE